MYVCQESYAPVLVLFMILRRATADGSVLDTVSTIRLQLHETPHWEKRNGLPAVAKC